MSKILDMMYDMIYIMSIIFDYRSSLADTINNGGSMSYNERNSVVSFISNLLIFGVYVVKIVEMYQSGEVHSAAVFSLWATIIVLGIIVTIAATIISTILFNIVSIIRTNREEPALADERDKLIELKGTRNAYYVLSIGILASMFTLVMNMSPLLMFNALIFAVLISVLTGDLSRLYLYRRGF